MMGTMFPKGIWALFGQLNDYDQSPDVLYGWWFEKPALEVLADALDVQFPAIRDEDTVAVVKIWSQTSEERINDVDYRLVFIMQGTDLDHHVKNSIVRAKKLPSPKGAKTK